jgi:putative ABC transport system permease protein
MLNDLRLALRTLPRMPGFAFAFVLTLGLGIGANTAIFSVINGVLLRPLPYPEADRIMHLRQPQVAAGIENTSFSFPEVADYRARSKTIDQFVEFGDWTFNVLGRGEPHRATGGLVTANFFPMLGAQPLRGAGCWCPPTKRNHRRRLPSSPTSIGGACSDPIRR